MTTAEVSGPGPIRRFLDRRKDDRADLQRRLDEVVAERDKLREEVEHWRHFKGNGPLKFTRGGDGSWFFQIPHRYGVMNITFNADFVAAFMSQTKLQFIGDWNALADVLAKKLDVKSLSDRVDSLEIEKETLVRIADSNHAAAAAFKKCLSETLEKLRASEQERESERRWEEGFRSVVSIVVGPREAFEIVDIVEEVRKLKLHQGADVKAVTDKLHRVLEAAKHVSVRIGQAYERPALQDAIQRLRDVCDDIKGTPRRAPPMRKP